MLATTNVNIDTNSIDMVSSLPEQAAKQQTTTIIITKLHNKFYTDIIINISIL